MGGGKHKGAGTVRNGGKVCNIVQYFAIGKAHRGGNCCGRGWELEVHGMESRNFGPSPTPPLYKTSLKKAT